MTRVAPAPVLLLLFAVAAGSGCGGDVPTSILLTISAESGVGEIDGIALDIFDDAGIAVSAHRVAADAGASISLPATIVLYPPRPGMLRLRALGSQQGTPRGEGVLQIVARAGEQVEATLALQIGRLADRDGDGVPDAVDNCPDVPNPRQRPCAGEAGSEGGADADAAADGPRDSGDAGDATADGVAPDTTGDATTDLPPCACPLGCKPASASCRRLVPSGGFTAGSYRTLGPINSSATIDTDACSGLGISGAVQSRGGATVCVLSVTRLQINNNVVVSVHGSRALVLLVDGDVDIRGVLDLGGKGATPGPGGFAGGVTPTGGPAMAGAGPGGGGVCSCPAGGIGGDDCGGAGGSFGDSGGAGGREGTACTSMSLPQSAYGTPTLEPLQGGSGGAGPGQDTGGAQGGQGGGGGGALQISAQGVLAIAGAITAGGGGGSGGAEGATRGGGGGGGSGGAVLLEGQRMSGAGAVAVNGGGGGAGGGGPDCGAGSAGDDSVVGPATGGTATGACGDGGDGAAGNVAPGVGADVTLDNAGGGGGGGLGRIRINRYSGSVPFSTSGKLSSGQATVN